MTAPIIGNGATIVFGTSGWTAKTKSITPSGRARESLDVTHLGSTPVDPEADPVEQGGKEFMPAGFGDPGELRVEFFLDPDDPPPEHQAPEQITVTWPLPDGLTTPATWVGTGFVTSFETGIEVDSVVMGTMVVKLTGVQTATPAS